MKAYAFLATFVVTVVLLWALYGILKASKDELADKIIERCMEAGYRGGACILHFRDDEGKVMILLGGRKLYCRDVAHGRDC